MQTLRESLPLNGGLETLRVSLPKKLIFASLIKAFLVGLRGLEPPTSRLSGVRSNHLSYKPKCFRRQSFVPFLPSALGGDEEDRTPDPLLARQVLSQLSYTPMWKLFHSRAGDRICILSFPF